MNPPPQLDYLREMFHEGWFNESVNFYIHPDGPQLLEPQVGDVMYTSLGGGISLEEIESEERQAQAHFIVNRGGRIIRRNGIPFIWPETDALLNERRVA
jgi:hypothetical protein